MHLIWRACYGPRKRDRIAHHRWHIVWESRERETQIQTIDGEVMRGMNLPESGLLTWRPSAGAAGGGD